MYMRFFAHPRIKRANRENFPATTTKNLAKMKIYDNITPTQLQKMRVIARALKFSPEQYAPTLSAKTREFLEKNAAYFGQPLNRSFWAKVEQIFSLKTRTIIHFSDYNVEFLDLEFLLKRAKNSTLCRIGNYVKAGEVCLIVCNKRITRINRANWREINAQLHGSNPKNSQDYDPKFSREKITRIQENRKREKTFDELREIGNIKKRKRGQAMSFSAHQALYQREAGERQLREFMRRFHPSSTEIS